MWIHILSDRHSRYFPFILNLIIHYFTRSILHSTFFFPCLPPRTVPHIQIDDNLAHIKSDASSECPNIWVPMFGIQTVKNRDLAVPQPDLSVCADRKIVILYVYLRNFTKKSQFYRAATQIEFFKMVFFCLWRKTIHTLSYAYLRICVFSKEIIA
jgi:hypothetical protein